jgi:N-acetylmuramoyl-L-alanine amidase
MRHRLIALCVMIAYQYALTQANNASSKAPLHVSITFPSHLDTFALAKVRIAGFTDPHAKVFISDMPVKVYPHGAFIGLVDLDPLMNKIIIRAEKDDQTAQDVLFIYRPPDPEPLPEFPTAIDENSMTPQSKTWLYPGEFMTVQFLGSPGGKAHLVVDKLEKYIPMIEMDPGTYSCTFRIKEGPTNRPLAISVYLKGRDSREVRVQVPGRLYLIPGKMPVIGFVAKTTPLFSAVNSTVPLGYLSDSIYVHIIGRINNKIKIKLTEDRVAYIDTTGLAVLPFGTPLPVTPISAPVVSNDREWLQLSLDVKMHVPFLVQHDVDRNQLELSVFGAYQTSSWIGYPNEPSEINRITLSQPAENVFVMRLDLKDRQQWGYRACYKNNKLILAVRQKPKIEPPPSGPFKNLVITVDPGHGGASEGTVSPTGIKEKDVNLAWGMALADLLRQAGARVILTRNDDTSMTLEERLRIARDAHSIIFLSLHNNATTPWGNALSARGTGAFFTIPQSQELAWTLYDRLIELGLAPYGRIYNSYYVTNVTDMIAVLIEGTFLSNPEEEQLFLSGDFVRSLAKALYAGLEDFLEAQRP